MAKNNPILKARADGKNEARLELRKVIFDYLEGKYMDGSIERGTPGAEMILEITRELSELLA